MLLRKTLRLRQNSKQPTAEIRQLAKYLYHSLTTTTLQQSWRGGFNDEPTEYIREGHVHILQHKEIPAYVSIFRIHGPFLFGATDKIDAIVSRLPDLPPIIILRLRNMTAIDSTGLQALENFADRVHESGRQLILCGAREQPAMRMHEAEFHEHVGEENICHSVAEALDRARDLHSEASKQHPAGASWGRRSTDVSLSTPALTVTTSSTPRPES